MEEAWVAVGQELANARRALRISKREAARRAGIAEITWRQYEAGVRQVAPGMKLPVNPSDENLEAAARAVDLEPAPLFALVGRTYQGPTAPEPPPDAEAELRVEMAEMRREMADLTAYLKRLAPHLPPPPDSE